MTTCEECFWFTNNLGSGKHGFCIHAGENLIDKLIRDKLEKPCKHFAYPLELKESKGKRGVNK